MRTDGRVTFHHNLYAHHRTRCPRPGTYGEEPGLLLDFRNNVIYNWGAPAGYSAEDAVRMNYVGNYLRPGPSTQGRDHAFSIGGDATTMFVAGNVLEGMPAGESDNWALVKGVRETSKAVEPFPAAPVMTDTAQETFRRVLESAGATLPVRDAVDARVVDTVENGTGHIINSQNDVGGWPDYGDAEPPPDTDADGMPDDWEQANGLDPRNPADHRQDKDGDGYTNIEEFLNGLSAHRSVPVAEKQTKTFSYGTEP